jgi:hypothetical protein
MRHTEPRTFWSTRQPLPTRARDFPSRPTSIPRLLTFAISDLPAPSGRIIDELPLIQQKLKTALGLGKGVTTERSYRGANRRGRIAEYAPWIADELGTSMCVVVTEPKYSRASLQQTTIPILDSAAYDARPGDVVVPRDGADSWGRVFGNAESRILAVPLITSVYERDSLLRYSPHVISESTMGKVELALAMHFGF